MTDNFLNFKRMKFDISSTKKIKIPSVDLLKEFRCSLALPEFVVSTKNVTINTAIYKPGIVIQDKILRDGTPGFVLVKKIYLLGNDILLGVQRLDNLGFDDHFYAYIVEYSTDFFLSKLLTK